MRKALILLAVAAVSTTAACSKKDAAGAAGSGGVAAAPAGAGGGTARGGRPPMPVEFGVAKRAPVAEQIIVVGNLIGAATVQVVPRVNGRLADVTVKLGDSVRHGQTVAKVEDSEIQEQVRQAEGAFKVAQATIRQRDADLKLAKTNKDRSESLYNRQLLPQQTYDDTVARLEAALAQNDLANAQFEQARARLEELKITLQNTIIASPVDGFVSKRFSDPGAFVGPNSPVVAVVDIRTVRMVANLVEKDMKRVPAGTAAAVEVDAYPGEKFAGRVSRVAPVFDPATRTAEMEIEIPNSSYRLKPGMYSRVQLTVDSRADAITIPRNALVEVDGKQGVFIASSGGGGGGRGQRDGGARGQQPAERAGTSGAVDAAGSTAGGGNAAAGSGQGQAPAPALTAKFLPVETGIRDGEHIEIKSGLNDGARIITTGASALKDGDRIVASSESRGRGERANREGSGQRQGSDR
jgi:RND family efflux transporter MFP subunit